MEVPEIEQNIEKKPVDFDIIASELNAVNSYYYEENIFHQQPKFKERVLRAEISLTEIFSKSYLLREIRRFDKIPLMVIWQVFGSL